MDSWIVHSHYDVTRLHQQEDPLGNCSNPGCVWAAHACYIALFHLQLRFMVLMCVLELSELSGLGRKESTTRINTDNYNVNRKDVHVTYHHGEGSLMNLENRSPLSPTNPRVLLDRGT